MLTKQHRYATRITNARHRQAYRLHMCGLCHALGDDFGLLARWLTSYEMILLNLLTNAQRPAAPASVPRRCPLNPTRMVATNTDSGSHLAAAAAVALAKVSVVDDVQDGGGLGARALNRLMERANAAALRALQDLDFEAQAITQLSTQQPAAEADPQQDPTTPTAATCAALFAATAQLAAQPHNAEPLSRLGAHYGAYLYLMDAYRDFAQDMLRGDYNPLHRYALQTGAAFSLSEDGRRWLLGRFERIRVAMQTELGQVQLARYADLLEEMLYSGLAGAIDDLRQSQARVFRRLGWADALKAAFFLVPITGTFTNGEPLPKKKRDHNHDSCVGGSGWYCDPGGCTGSDCDCSSCRDNRDDGESALCAALGFGGCDGCGDSAGCNGCDAPDCSGGCDGGGCSN